MNETTQLALSALAFVSGIVGAVISGYLLSVIKSERVRAAQDVTQIGLNLDVECDARRSELASAVKQLQGAIDKEGDVRREQLDRLGMDVSKIRERMAYDRGIAGKPFPEGD